MFYIEAKGRKEFFHNDLGDDFIRFMPRYFKCKPEELKVRYVPDGVEPEVKNSKKFIELESSYPYEEAKDGTLKFKGNVLKGSKA